MWPLGFVSAGSASAEDATMWVNQWPSSWKTRKPSVSIGAELNSNSCLVLSKDADPFVASTVKASRISGTPRLNRMDPTRKLTAYSSIAGERPNGGDTDARLAPRLRYRLSLQVAKPCDRLNQHRTAWRPEGRFGNYLGAGRWTTAGGTGSTAVFRAAASARRARAGSEVDPVRFMIEARWFSTVRWLMPRSAAMFLLG